MALAELIPVPCCWLAFIGVWWGCMLVTRRLNQVTSTPRVCLAAEPLPWRFLLAAAVTGAASGLFDTVFGKGA